MNILIIHNDYQQPGGETAIYKAEVALLRQKGHAITTYWRENAEITSYNWLQKITLAPATIFSRQTYHEVEALIKKERPQIAHIHNVFPLISPSVYGILWKAHIPIVQTVHNMRFLCPNGIFYTKGKICERCKYGNTIHAVRYQCFRNSYWLSTLYALSIGINRKLGTFQKISRFIALTQFTANVLVESGIAPPEKIQILGNFITDPLPLRKTNQVDPPYIAYIGRLSREKGVELLIQVMQQLPHINLKIAGDGPIKPQLVKLAQTYHNIEFVGFLKDKEKDIFLSQALCTVIPSQCHETFGLVALESMAVGTPVIASNLGGLPYLIQNMHSGLIFQYDDPSDLKSKILFCFNDKQISNFGKHGSEIVQKKFSAQAHISGLEKIFEQTLAEFERINA